MTTIIRHPRENLRKCTLTPLEGRPDLRFLTWDRGLRFDATGYTLLAVDAPPLAPSDARPLLLLDATWRLLPDLLGGLAGAPTRRSLPAVPTAYPRRSRDGSDPARGLASVEALYLARRVLGLRDDSLLDHYRWRGAFLAGVDAHE